MTDRRIRKTLHSLESALYVLLKELPYERITVNKLCAQANCSRSTFYAHYMNMDDFVDDILTQASGEYVHMLYLNFAQSLHERSSDSLVEVYRRVIHPHLEQLRLLRTIPNIHQRIQEIISQSLTMAVQGASLGDEISPIRKDLFILNAVSIYYYFLDHQVSIDDVREIAQIQIQLLLPKI